MRTTPDAVIGTLACTQHGVVTRPQALRAGLTDRMIASRVERALWRRVFRGVYVVVGVPSNWHQDLWAAYLAVGGHAVATHETALVLHGLDPRHVPRYPFTFTVEHGAHPRVPGAIVHQIGDIRPHHVGTVDGLPTTIPARAIVDLAATVGSRRLGGLVDLTVDRLTSVARISVCAAEVARPGKRGLARLGQVLDERGPGYVPPKSELEGRLLRAVAGGGLPAPVRQFRLPGRGAVDGCVDAAYPDVRLILEADGRRWHTRIRDLRRDHERDAEAARAGWQTLRFLYEQISESASDVVETVADVRLVRSQQLGRRAG